MRKKMAPVVELQPGVELVSEGVAIDGLLARSTARGIPSLGHEVLQDPVKDGPIVVALHAQLHEVPHRLYPQKFALH